MTPGAGIVLQALQDGIIKWANQLAFCSIRISVDDNRNIRSFLSICLQKWQKFLVDNNRIGIGVFEYISNIVWLESIVYRYK